MLIYIINGPNLNLLGQRETSIYGTNTYQKLKQAIMKKAKALKVKVKIFQTNDEAKFINLLQQAYYKKVNAVIINPAAYSHYSIAIYDAIKAISIPCLEVHLSDISTREDFRKISITSKACIKTIMGEGFNSYLKALDYLVGEVNV